MAGDPPRPNILWLVSEDTSPDLGCYGNPLVHTPHLDRLAEQGARYDAALATCPVCSPARSAMMTGMYQTSIGAHNHRSHREDGHTLPEPVRVITHYFREAGYFVTNGRGTDWERPGKTDWNFTPSDSPFDGADWAQRAPGQPFFAQYNFSLTHRDFVRDPERPIDPAQLELPPYYPDTPLVRRDWADYLESLQVLDRQIGALLKRLEDEGLADNTIVVYHGDHGRPHVRDKQWLYEGGIRVPLIVRKPGGAGAGKVSKDLVSLIDLAPTMMRWAGITPPAHLQGQALEDIAQREFVVSARDRCDETVDRIRCLRTKRYKYIRNFYPDRPYTQFNAYKKLQYPALGVLEQWKAEGKLNEAQQAFMAERRPEEELYDLRADPHELENLAKNIEYKQLLERMRGQLDQWIADTNDQGALPEPAAVTNHWLEEARGRFEKTMQQRGLAVDATPVDHVAWWEKKLLG
ncbi:MAG: sulfatase [Candidatus Hydrogenedentes bacterium]|nr:sulfatase [Candidatus Hydrogenedentota bacterium]